MTILGIDPGLAKTGWGVITAGERRCSSLGFGVISTSSERILEERIFSISSQVYQLIKQFNPQAVCIEDVYFAKNISSALPVAKVIGAVIAVTFGEKLPCRVFTPLQIKTSVTGMGRAEKLQVQEMVRLILGLSEVPSPDHAADALAAAICYHHMFSSEQRMGL